MAYKSFTSCSAELRIDIQYICKRLIFWIEKWSEGLLKFTIKQLDSSHICYTYPTVQLIVRGQLVLFFKLCHILATKIDVFDDNVGTALSRWMEKKKNKTGYFWIPACFISAAITQKVHLCFVASALLFLLGMTLRNRLAWIPLSRVIFKKVTFVGKREQAEEA